MLMTLQDAKKKLTIESDQSMPFNHSVCLALMAIVDILDAAVPLSVVLWDRTADGTAPVYTYRIVAKDGRVWKQIVTYAVGAPEPTMTFIVTDQWKMSEFALQRPIRDLLSQNAVPYGLSKVRLDYV